MKCERIKKRADFVRLQRYAKSRALPAFVLLYNPVSENEIRVGFTASKKVGNSVQRNRARRRMRAVIDKVIRLNSQFNSETGYEMVLIARYKITDRNFDRMCEELSSAVKELGCEV